MAEGKQEVALPHAPKGKASHIVTQQVGEITGIFPGEAQSLTRETVAVARGEQVRGAGRFIRKTLKNREAVQRFVEHHALLKKYDFPVPSTVRSVKDSNDILISDLSEGGEKQVFSYNELIFQAEKKVGVLRNGIQLEHELHGIVEKAEMLGITLSEEVYFLVVDKQGNGNIVLGDLGDGVSQSTAEGGLLDRFREQAAQNFYKKIQTHFDVQE